MSRTLVRVGALTDVGRLRDHNEDAYGYRHPDDRDTRIRRKGSLFVVCDGMGGHQAGEVASQLAVDVILDAYFNDPTTDPALSLVNAVKLANSRIYQQSSERSELRGMGTTCVATVVFGDRSLIAHAGDSRAYLLRDGELVQITKDHSWVSQQVQLGLLSAEEARDHPMMNIITRALGHTPEVDVDITPCLIEEGDLFMLCSDGLSGRVDDDQIRDILQSTPDLDEAARILVTAANDNGGPDNISVVLVYVDRIEQTGASLPVIVQTVGEFGTDVNTTQQQAVNGHITGQRPAVTGPVTTGPIDIGPIEKEPLRRRRMLPVVLGGLMVVLAIVAALLVGAVVAVTQGWIPGVQPPAPAAGGAAPPAPTTAPIAAPVLEPTAAPTATAAAAVRPNEGNAPLVNRRVQIAPGTNIFQSPQGTLVAIPAVPATLLGTIRAEQSADPPPNSTATPVPAGRTNRTWVQVELDGAPGRQGWVWIGNVTLQ